MKSTGYFNIFFGIELTQYKVIFLKNNTYKCQKIVECIATRLTKEGSQLATNYSQLTTQSANLKFCETDPADMEQLFRLIESV